MHNTKKCRNCGKDFEGRSNQFHCSHKCKTEYFQKKENAQAQTTPPIIKEEFAAKTALELRRLELQYEKEMAMLKAQEREQEREWELKKEQEKTIRLQEHLKHQEKQKTISHTQEDDADEYALPNSLQKNYDTTIQKVIDLQDTKVKVFAIKSLKSTLESLLDKLERFEAKQGFEEDEHTDEYDLVADTLDEVETWLENKFSLVDMRNFSIDEDLYDDLVESLETEESE